MVNNLKDWWNWKWQIQNSVRSLDVLQRYLSLSETEISAFKNVQNLFRFSATPYYLSLINANDPQCPIKKQIIPNENELIQSVYAQVDPLAEETNMPVKGITHRYPDRAIWYLSHLCPVYCRFCTRKRKVGQIKNTPNANDRKLALQYIRSHNEIREIILSGGDPLSLSDRQLYLILKDLKSIKHLNQIRIHTRIPVTLPFRITKPLCDVLSEFFPIYIVTHFNHPREITDVTRECIKNLIQRGHVIILNQNVLLKDINDNPETLKELYYNLISIGIKPYYVHQCDEVYGTSHFKVPIAKGIQIMKELRGNISGICNPTYVVDLTGGGGKVPLSLEYLVKETDKEYFFRNYKGDIFKIYK